MPCRTRQNTINKLLGIVAEELLGPNPKRKAIVFTPLAGVADIANVIVAQVFTAGLLQLWTVPENVTQLVALYGWGCGGNAGAAGALLGGGGGGGGAFTMTEASTIVPGTVYVINVGTGGSLVNTNILRPAGTTLLDATAGNNGLLDVQGLGGGLGTGTRRFTGGDGVNAAALAGAGGGGGGAAGSFANGTAGAVSVGGAGGGTATRPPYGVGGTGGNGGIIAAAGLAGASPGAGAGGSGATGPASGTGADGLLVLFYQIPNQGQAISLSPRQDVVAGRGVLNYIPGINSQTILTDEDIGDAITLPWWVVSAIASVPIQIVEYSYDD